MMTTDQFMWVLAAPAAGIAVWLIWQRSRFLVGWASCMVTTLRMWWRVHRWGDDMTDEQWAKEQRWLGRRISTLRRQLQDISPRDTG